MKCTYYYYMITNNIEVVTYRGENEDMQSLTITSRMSHTIYDSLHNS
jgi:hypothetical protein